MLKNNNYLTIFTFSTILGSGIGIGYAKIGNVPGIHHSQESVTSTCSSAPGQYKDFRRLKINITTAEFDGKTTIVV